MVPVGDADADADKALDRVEPLTVWCCVEDR
jgi:hypothetical protein